MFEEMTFEKILSDMLSDMPDGINTREGSLLYNACVKQAVRLEEAYLVLAGIERNMFADTADIEHLIRMGNDRGAYINRATYAEFEAQFNCPIELGARFNLGEFNYTVFNSLDEEENTYRIGCEDPGSEPNHLLGDLEPIEFISGFEWGKITKCLIPGTDQEATEIYRARLLANYNFRGFAGNRAYYKERIGEQPGVLGCKLKRRDEFTNKIDITIIGEDYRTPSEEVVNAVQTACDPVVNSGEGDGFAPIGHRVTIHAVQETAVNITTTITYDSSHAYEDVASYIDKAIEEYLLSLRQTWRDVDDIVVRILRIEAAIVEVEGVLDVTGTTINGAESNLMISDGTVPVKGEITCL